MLVSTYLDIEMEMQMESITVCCRVENAMYIYIYIHICVRVFGENDAYVMGMITGLTHNYRDLVDRNLDNSWDFSTGILHEGREYPNLALNSLKMMRTVGFWSTEFSDTPMWVAEMHDGFTRFIPACNYHHSDVYTMEISLQV